MAYSSVGLCTQTLFHFVPSSAYDALPQSPDKFDLLFSKGGKAVHEDKQANSSSGIKESLSYTSLA